MSDVEAFDELCAYTLTRGDAEFIHQHVVDTFAAQTANEFTKPITLTFALEGTAPAGLSLSPVGALAWNPTEDQGPSTNKNNYDFPTLASIDTFQAEQLQKPPGADFWEWIKTAKMPV